MTADPTDPPGEERAGGAPDADAPEDVPAPRWRDSLAAAREEARETGALLFVDLYDPG